MRTPQMPSGLKTQLRYGFAFQDVETIVELNKVWFKHVKQLRQLAKEEAEAQQATIDEKVDDIDENL